MSTFEMRKVDPMRCVSFSCSTILLLVLAAHCCLSDPPASFVSPEVAVIREKQVAIIAIPRTPTQVQMLVGQMATHGFTTLYLPTDYGFMPVTRESSTAARFPPKLLLASAVNAGKRNRVGVYAIINVYPRFKRRSAMLQRRRLERLASSLAVLPGLKGIVLENVSATASDSSAAPFQVRHDARPRADEMATLSALHRDVHLVNPSIPMFIHWSSSKTSFDPWGKPLAGDVLRNLPTSPDVVRQGSVLVVSFNRSYGGCFKCGDGVYTSLEYPLAHYNHQLGGIPGAVAFDLRPELAEGTLFSSFRYLTQLTHMASSKTSDNYKNKR